MPHFRLPLRDIPDFFRTAKARHFSWGKLYWQPNTDAGFRFTIVVPKTTAKSAVQRNRIKRQLRECLRLAPLSPALDVVLVIHRLSDATEVWGSVQRFWSSL